MKQESITKSAIAKELGVSRAYITMLCNGKRKASDDLILKIKGLTVNKKLRTSVPKSCSSANSDTSPYPETLTILPLCLIPGLGLNRFVSLARSQSSVSLQTGYLGRWFLL